MQTTVSTRSSQSIKTFTTITPVPQSVYPTVPRKIAEIETTYQSPTAESVSDSDISARGIANIHPELQSLLPPSKKDRRSSHGANTKLHESLMQ